MGEMSKSIFQTQPRAQHNATISRSITDDSKKFPGNFVRVSSQWCLDRTIDV